MDIRSTSQQKVSYLYDNLSPSGRSLSIEMLPEEVFRRILLFLGESSLSAMSLVCKHLNQWTVTALSHQSLEAVTVFERSGVFEEVFGQKIKFDENLVEKYSQCKSFREIILLNIEAAKKISQLCKEPKFDPDYVEKQAQIIKVKEQFDLLLDGIGIRFAIDVVATENWDSELGRDIHKKIFLRLFETDNLTLEFADKIEVSSEYFPELCRTRWSDLCERGESEQVIREAEKIRKRLPKSSVSIVKELTKQNLIDRASEIANEEIDEKRKSLHLSDIVLQLIETGDIPKALVFARRMPLHDREQSAFLSDLRNDALRNIYISCVDLENYALADEICPEIFDDYQDSALEHMALSWLKSGKYVEGLKYFHSISPHYKQDSANSISDKLVLDKKYHAAEMMASHILDEETREAVFKAIEESRKSSSLLEVAQNSETTMENSDEDVKEPPLKRQKTE